MTSVLGPKAQGDGDNIHSPNIQNLQSGFLLLLINSCFIKKKGMFNSEIKQAQHRNEGDSSRPLMPKAPTPGFPDAATDSPNMNADTVVKFC